MVAIIIPTKDRSEFIKRLLYYYAENNCSNRFYIADSSNLPEHINSIKNTISELAKFLDVTYAHYPNANIEEAKRLILEEHVVEKYAAYCGDDDFLVSETLQECANFLDKNSDYSNCHGKGLLFTMHGDPINGSIGWVADYNLHSNELEDPLMRLDLYLRNYWPIWTVRRTEEFKATLGSLRSIPLESFREITMGCLPMICGKTKMIDSLYVSRQIHNKRYGGTDPISAFLAKDWHLAYQEMLLILSQKLSKDFFLNEIDCKKTIEASFSEYYRQVLVAKLVNKEEGFNMTLSIKSFLKKNFKYFYKLYLKYGSSKMNLEKLRSFPPKNYSEFNKLHQFLDSYTN
jgi:glycosyltransferase domain-containing protein